MDAISTMQLDAAITSAPAGGSDHIIGLPAHTLEEANLKKGDFALVTFTGEALARIEVLPPDQDRAQAQLSPSLAFNIGLIDTGSIRVNPVALVKAERITFSKRTARPKTETQRVSLFGKWRSDSKQGQRAASTTDRDAIGARILGQALLKGNLLFPNSEQKQELQVVETVPEGAVVISENTELRFLDPDARRTGYDDIGGLTQEVAKVREMVELPLNHPELFEQLGIDAPRGVLMYGPPGCGKTLIARAVAEQTDAVFLTINGPEVIQKHYGESEELLRRVFEEAQKHRAAILFIDEVDALAPNRETVLGEVEKRVVGQLLALMDGVSSRGNIVVMAATNLPNNVDPALRRPGRFDREIGINPPGKAGRAEILSIHTRFMPLAADVDLERIAAVTHGFLGSDLAALCREAAMRCARTASLDHSNPSRPISRPFVGMSHFLEALEDFKLSTIRELNSDIPETSWADIGGLDDERQRLTEALEWPRLYADHFAEVGLSAPRGILLTGPSGTGKTLLAHAVGANTEVNFITVKGPELLSKWVGDSERGIRETFRRARQSAPSVIFFDELDAIVPARGSETGDGQIGDRMVGQFLLELDSLGPHSDVIVIGASNRADRIDQALLRPGRFDLVLDLKLPDAMSRQKILEVHCRTSQISSDVSFEALAGLTEGMSGADIAGLCQRAKMLAIKAIITEPQKQGGEPTKLAMHHFQQALVDVKR
nr:AAA family ATPase [uncultured Cohaesibacter sp.]